MSFRVSIDSLITDSSLSTHFVDSTYYEPENREEEEYARLFMNIEVRNNPSVSRTLRRIIFDAFTTEMYHDMKMDISKAFEYTLREINGSLEEIMKEEGTDWVKDMHVVLAVLAQDTLHVSVCGEAEMILIQKGKAMNITEGLVESVDLEHIFQNIASGKVYEGDTLLAVNMALPEPVQKALAGWAQGDVQSLFERLESELKHYAYSVLGFQLLPQAKDAEVVQSFHTEEETRADIKPKKIAFAKIFSTLKNIFIPPEFHNTDLEGKKEVKHEKPLEESLEEEVPSLFEEPARDVRKYNEQSDLSDLKQAVSSSVRRASSKVKWKNTLDLLKRNIFQIMKKGTRFSGQYSQRRTSFGSKYLRGNSLMIIIIAVILLFVSVSIFSKYKENQVVEELRGKITFIDEKIRDAKTRNALDEKEEARSIVEQIRVTLTELQDFKYLKNEVAAKVSEVSELEDRINEITRVDAPEEYSDLSRKYEGADAHSIFKVEDAIYVVAKKAVFKLLLSEIVLEPFDNLLQEGEYSVKAVPFEDQRGFLIVTNLNRLFEYNNGEITEAVLLEEGSKWVPMDSLRTYGRRLYVVDRAAGTVWRYAKQNAGYLAPTSYNPFDTNIAIGNIKDLSIDGDIYYLMDDGTIRRTRSQANEEFTLTEFPSEIDFSTSTKVLKSSVLSQLFIFDKEKKRVVVTGYKGYYAKQYIFDTLSDVQDIFVDEGNRKLYVLTLQKVYVLSL